jgi:hypothetical protein
VANAANQSRGPAPERGPTGRVSRDRMRTVAYRQDRNPGLLWTMEQLTVYRYEVWNREEAKRHFAPRMATREAIRRVKGEADLTSAMTVGRDAIDSNGFCLHDTPIQSKNTS